MVLVSLHGWRPYREKVQSCCAVVVVAADIHGDVLSDEDLQEVRGPVVVVIAGIAVV